MSDEDAAIHNAIRAAWKRYYGRSIEWQVSDPEHIAYDAGVLAGMRRAVEYVHYNSDRNALIDAIHQLEQEQQR